MDPSAMFAYNESFDSNLFDFLDASWPNHETLFGSLSDTRAHTYFDSLQDPSFSSSDKDFNDLMNQLVIGMGQSRAISTSNVNSREVTSDPSRLSRPWEGDANSACFPVNSYSVRRQQTPYSLPSSSTRLGGVSTPSSTPGCVRPREASRTCRSVSARNQAATTDQADEIKLLLRRGDCGEELPNDLICPVRGCFHKQLNGRMQDFRRHLGTHLHKNGEILCKGVPLEQFLRDRDLFPKISMEEEQPYEVPEEDGLWIGGCLKTFSRRDALKRHLRKTSCSRSRISIVTPPHT